MVLTDSLLLEIEQGALGVIVLNMMEQKPDIRTEADVVIFVNSFYDKVLTDDLLRPIFVEKAHLDLQQHLPTMYSFWSSILLGAQTYKGQPFLAHLPFQEHLTPAHFTRWLTLFDETIDTYFEGEIAEQAKQRARNIAWVFQSKMGLLQS